MTDLITPEQRARLLANGAEMERDEDFDPVPVLKLSIVETGATWLLASLDPDCPAIGFALADLGFGFPEMGSVGLSEIIEVCAERGLTLRRDPAFVGKKPLGDYATEARRTRTIVTD